MRVKICGLTTPETLEATIAASADMAGFVFFERSSRHLTLELARELGQQAAGRITKVALLVDATDKAIAEIVQALVPDLLQLHGSETPARMAEIKSRFGIPVMRAFGIADKTDLAEALAGSAEADALLFDAKPPKGNPVPGGNGVSFDWGLMSGLQMPQPWMLSGGLAPQNVALAIAQSGAPGVDVSSGVESSAGVKDIAKIHAFVAAARQA